MTRLILTLTLALALAAPAAANCLPASQAAVYAVTMLNAYSISRYGWQGDRWYDQVMPRCGSHPGFIEFGCNVAFDVGLTWAEDTANRDTDDKHVKLVCIGNYLGAAAFAYYTRHALSVQLFHFKL